MGERKWGREKMGERENGGEIERENGKGTGERMGEIERERGKPKRKRGTEKNKYSSMPTSNGMGRAVKLPMTPKRRLKKGSCKPNFRRNQKMHFKCNSGPVV